MKTLNDWDDVTEVDLLAEVSTDDIIAAWAIVAAAENADLDWGDVAANTNVVRKLGAL